MTDKSMLFGLSIGNPYARAQIPLDMHPRALDTPKTTVKKSYSTKPKLNKLYHSAGEVLHCKHQHLDKDF